MEIVKEMREKKQKETLFSGDVLAANARGKLCNCHYPSSIYFYWRRAAAARRINIEGL